MSNFTVDIDISQPGTAFLVSIANFPINDNYTECEFLFTSTVKIMLCHKLIKVDREILSQIITHSQQGHCMFHVKKFKNLLKERRLSKLFKCCQGQINYLQPIAKS